MYCSLRDESRYVTFCTFLFLSLTFMGERKKRKDSNIAVQKVAGDDSVLHTLCKMHIL